jgi:ribonuclease J
MSANGHLGVSLVVAGGRLEDGPVVVARGLSEPDGRPADESLDPIDEAAVAALDGMKRSELEDDERLEKILSRAVRRAAEQQFGKRPLVDITIHRI